jgi:hypothetical protein
MKTAWRSGRSLQCQDTKNIYIEPLRLREAVRDMLLQHGWRLHGDDGGYTAHHRAVRDAPTARQKLQALGLLTSSSVRIEFGLPAHEVGLGHMGD